MIIVDKSDKVGYITDSGIACFQTIGQGVCFDISSKKEIEWKYNKKAKIVRSIRWDKNISEGVYEGTLKAVILNNGICFLSIDNKKQIVPTLKLSYYLASGSVDVYKMYGRANEHREKIATSKGYTIEDKMSFVDEYSKAENYQDIKNILIKEAELKVSAKQAEIRIEGFIKSFDIPNIEIYGKREKVSVTDNYFTSNEDDESLVWKYEVDTVEWHGKIIDFPTGNRLDVLYHIGHGEQLSIRLFSNHIHGKDFASIADNCIAWIEENKSRIRTFEGHIYLFPKPLEV
jgi:hypothetical protein